MKLSKQQSAEMLEAAKPLIKWLNENCHPMCEIVVEQNSVKLTEDVARETTGEFLKD